MGKSSIFRSLKDRFSYTIGLTQGQLLNVVFTTTDEPALLYEELVTNDGSEIYDANEHKFKTLR